MPRKAVTARDFADQLTAAGAKIVWNDDTEFDVSHGKGTKARSARVNFYRDSHTFYYARSGSGAPLRSMRAVHLHLRLSTDPVRKTAPDLASELRRGGAVITWFGTGGLNFDAARDARIVHVHCRSDDKTFLYARAEGRLLESMSAVRQHLGIDQTPASRFADELQVAGATVHWRDSSEFQADRTDAGTKRSVVVVFNPATKRFGYGATSTGMPLRTKDAVRNYLSLPATG